MCAAFQIGDKTKRPGKRVGAHGPTGKLKVTWVGFARNEIRPWWEKRGLIPVDVPAEKFAERSKQDRSLRWGVVPKGLVIRGLYEENEGNPSVIIVTRPSSSKELRRFGHDRMPVLEEPLFSNEPFELEEPETRDENAPLLPGFDF